MKRIWQLIILIFMGIHGLNAQQLPIYSQFMMNGFLINPAIAGSDGMTSVSLTAREQWIGFNMAPRTHSASFQTRLLKRSYIIKNRSPKKKTFLPARTGRVGIGGFIFDDRSGIVNRTGFQLSYAYHIFVKNTQISFGLSGSAFQFKLLNENINTPGYDPYVESALRNVVYVPDASCGIFVTHSKFYAGASAAQLFQSRLNFGNSDFRSYKLIRCYYLMGSYKINMDENYELEPGVFLASPQNAIGEVDLSCKLFYKDNYWFGMSYRTTKAIIGMVGFRANRIFVGYSFDFSLTPIQMNNWGTHEVTLALKFGDSVRRYRWLNRY
jgi:type IX secretion system PorP/SprF family membrane protein